LIKVADKRLGDTAEIEMADGEKAVYASRVRSLVAAVYDWSRFNGIPRGYEWIRQELKTKRVTAADLAKCTLRYGDTGAIRRMARCWSAKVWPPRCCGSWSRRWRTSGLIPSIPNRPKPGTFKFAGAS